MKNVKRLEKTWAILFFCVFAEVWPNITLPKIISSNMVLQQGIKVPIWGSASPGENIEVDFNGQVKTTVADYKGKWKVSLDPLKAGGPFQMLIQGENPVVLGNIMVGEVWVCSGQSNMAMLLSQASNPDGKNIGCTGIRLFNTYFDAPWSECTPAMADVFSAVGYFFGKTLYDSLKIPIGLIQSSWGGTCIEQWMSPHSILEDPDLDTADWIPSTQPSKAGSHFQDGIAPLIPYAVRGVVWYQGEGNTIYATDKYLYRFEALVKGWRREWGQGNFPFYYVQLASFNMNADWPAIREAQRLALYDLDNCAMAVAIDVGESDNVHPHNKAPVGRRLALIALARDYGFAQCVYSGPLFRGMTVHGDTSRLSFDFEGSGLVAGKCGLKGFEIAGSDGMFKAASAIIRDNRVLAYACGVHPVAARYGWGSDPPASLFNREGLPASPFRTYSLDSLPPELGDAVGTSTGTVIVRFSKKTGYSGASDVSNYRIDDTIPVSSAVLQSDLTTVQLTTAALSRNADHTISVSGVRTLWGPSRTMTAVKRHFIAGPPATQLTGTIIGKGRPYQNNPDWSYEKALDGNMSTFADCIGDSLYAGYDFGAGRKMIITGIQFMPRPKFAQRMVSQSFEASKDGAGWFPLYTVTSVPAESTFTSVAIARSDPVRFVRYNGSSGYLNVSGIKFFGFPAPAKAVVKRPAPFAEYVLCNASDKTVFVKINTLDGRCITTINSQNTGVMSNDHELFSLVTRSIRLSKGVYILKIQAANSESIVRKIIRSK